MRQLARHPQLGPTHPWHDVDQMRLECIRLWSEERFAEANQKFVRALQHNAQSPFLWATYHRFIHDMQGREGMPRDQIVSIPGGSVTGPFAMYRFFGRCQVARAIAAGGWNGFEPPCPLILARWIKAVGGTFCDVGANSGYYTLLALAAGARWAIAFEPFPAAAEVMRSSIELNGWSEKADVRESAVADEAGNSTFFLPMQSHGLLETSASQDPDFRPPHSFKFEAEVTTLDALLPELSGVEGAEGTEPLTVKVDVEGEGPTLAVLRGAAELIRRMRPVMMVEYLYGAGDGLQRLLKDYSYKSVVCRGDGTGFVESQVKAVGGVPNHFFVPEERMEVFLGVIGG